MTDPFQTAVLPGGRYAPKTTGTGGVRSCVICRSCAQAGWVCELCLTYLGLLDEGRVRMCSNGTRLIGPKKVRRWAQKFDAAIQKYLANREKKTYPTPPGP